VVEVKDEEKNQDRQGRVELGGNGQASDESGKPQIGRPSGVRVPQREKEGDHHEDKHGNFHIGEMGVSRVQEVDREKKCGRYPGGRAPDPPADPMHHPNAGRADACGRDAADQRDLRNQPLIVLRGDVEKLEEREKRGKNYY
jgi:hypothetical protein